MFVVFGCAFIWQELHFNRDVHKYVTYRLIFYFWIYEKASVFVFTSHLMHLIHNIVTFENILNIKSGNNEYKLSEVILHYLYMLTFASCQSICVTYCGLACPVVILNLLCPCKPLLHRL